MLHAIDEKQSLFCMQQNMLYLVSDNEYHLIEAAASKHEFMNGRKNKMRKAN